MCGAALQDALSVDWSVKPIYPNLPLMIVGPSGIGKTGAMRAAMPLFEGCLPHRIAEDCTAEAATADFAERGRTRIGNTCALWSVPELADVFGQKDYQQGSVARLTRLFDNPRDRETHRRTSSPIRIQGDSVLSWIAGTTIDWLREHVDEAVSAGGFLPRLFVVYLQSPPKFIPNPQHDYEIIKKLNTEILQLTRDVLFSPHKIPVGDEWDAISRQAYDDYISRFGTDGATFAARRDENVLRIWLILNKFGQMRANAVKMRVAETCAKWIENQVLTLSSDLRVREFGWGVSRLRAYLEDKKCVSYTTLSKNLGIPSHDLKSYLKELWELGEIKWDGRPGQSTVEWLG